MNKTILITGAGTGIGRDTAFALAARGHQVHACTFSEEQADALRTECATRRLPLNIFKMDITSEADRAQINALKLDVLINNAGIGGTLARWWEQDSAAYRGVFDTNLTAAVELSRLVLPEMVARRSGHIINMGSVAGRVAFSSLYSASKYGLRGFSFGLRRELLGSGVNVSLVAPGFIRTDMTSWGPPLPMPGPEIVARAVLHLLDHPRAEVIVPGWYRPLTWLETLFPGWMDHLAHQNFSRRNTVQDE